MTEPPLNISPHELSAPLNITLQICYPTVGSKVVLAWYSCTTPMYVLGQQMTSESNGYRKISNYTASLTPYTSVVECLLT